MAKKKVEKNKEPEPVRLLIKYHESKTGGQPITDPEYPDNSWPDHEDEYVEFSLSSVEIYKPKPENQWGWNQEVVSIDFPVKVGDTVYVVVVRYTTGGTFGTTYGAWNIEGVYSDLEKAEEVVKSVYNGTYPGYKCWMGYFEKLEGCDSFDMVVG